MASNGSATGHKQGRNKQVRNKQVRNTPGRVTLARVKLAKRKFDVGPRMNKINRKVEYALIGLKHMRSKMPGELTTVKELSSLYGCPFDATSRVMQILGQKGILRSEQGAHGGYMIAKDLARVSFYELMEVILGPVAVARCLHDASESPCEIRDTCNIVSPVQALNRRLADFYKSLSVAELLERGPAKSARAQLEEAIM